MLSSIIDYFAWRLRFRLFSRVTYCFHALAFCLFWLALTASNFAGLFVTWGAAALMVAAPFIGVFLYDLTRFFISWLLGVIHYIVHRKEYMIISRERYQKMRNSYVNNNRG